MKGRRVPYRKQGVGRAVGRQALRSGGRHPRTESRHRADKNAGCRRGRICRGKHGGSCLGAKTAARILAPLALFAAAAAFAQAPDERDAKLRAFEAWRAGYLLHLDGHYERAVEQFRASIDAYPTAEGHTFLGWSLGHLGKLEEAIAQCRSAIRLDPDFGNPYNDIGVYLIALGRHDEAIQWLEKAIAAKRYCCYHYPHTNLGRVLLEKGRLAEARRHFERALELEPGYAPAVQGLEIMKGRTPS